jgi:C4-dicarboxylate-specific signal transduction histidine kinase
MDWEGLGRNSTTFEESFNRAYEKLKSTQAQLVQSAKLASIGELASGIAHELNQPLMVIRGTAQLIRRGHRKSSFAAEDLLENIGYIEKNTKRMMNIINHLRIFSRQSQADIESVDVNKIIEECFLMVGEQLRLRNIQVKKDLAPDLPKVLGDANLLKQVFLNLMTNARDAMNDGGTLNIVTRYLLSHTGNEDSETNIVEMSFSDTGGGISSECLGKVFDPFFTTKEVGKGTGLGLSISYGIMKDHQGEIEIALRQLSGTKKQENPVSSLVQLFWI